VARVRFFVVSFFFLKNKKFRVCVFFFCFFSRKKVRQRERRKREMREVSFPSSQKKSS
jgi:hypothetical protein